MLGSLVSEISHERIDLIVGDSIEAGMRCVAFVQGKTQPFELVLEINPVLTCESRDGAATFCMSTVTGRTGSAG